MHQPIKHTPRMLEKPGKPMLWYPTKQRYSFFRFSMPGLLNETIHDSIAMDSIQGKSHSVKWKISHSRLLRPYALVVRKPHSNQNVRQHMHVNLTAKLLDKKQNRKDQDKQYSCFKCYTIGCWWTWCPLIDCLLQRHPLEVAVQKGIFYAKYDVFIRGKGSRRIISYWWRDCLLAAGTFYTLWELKNQNL